MSRKVYASILGLVCLALGFLMSCSSSSNSSSTPPPSGLNVNNAGSLQKLWSYATGDVVFSSPAVVNGVVYVGSNDGVVHAFGLKKGRE